MWLFFRIKTSYITYARTVCYVLMATAQHFCSIVSAETPPDDRQHQVPQKWHLRRGRNSSNWGGSTKVPERSSLITSLTSARRRISPSTRRSPRIEEELRLDGLPSSLLNSRRAWRLSLVLPFTDCSNRSCDVSNEQLWPSFYQAEFLIFTLQERFSWLFWATP